MEPSLLSGWENFYVIVGSSAGGLTGLTFVVIALVADAVEKQRKKPTGLGTYVTPTVVHFGVVLALAAYLSVPRQTAISLSVGLGAAGLGGVIYSIVTAVSMRRHPTYKAVLDDWVWTVILPTLTYTALLGMAALMLHSVAQALYGIAAISAVLLFIGIHNAWDIAVWMLVYMKREPE